MLWQSLGRATGATTSLKLVSPAPSGVPDRTQPSAQAVKTRGQASLCGTGLADAQSAIDLRSHRWRRIGSCNGATCHPEKRSDDAHVIRAAPRDKGYQFVIDLILKLASCTPRFLSAVVSHLGFIPLPDQTCEWSAGLRYFGGTFRPASGWALGRDPFVAGTWPLSSILINA